MWPISYTRVENGPLKWGGSDFKDKNQKSSRGVWGHAPPGKFGIFDSQRVFLRPSDSSFEASLYCVRHIEKYIHLKNEGAQPPPSFKVGGGGLNPLCPPYFSAYAILI